ncbi:hypothetical protein E2C01_079310 [Portunus trituberculatus]|uniref:Uncharacterized protein n=1 Tax=Portunus trituberculatus TaxID=210409 RepID=A0A5B7IR36_PORTR|nr:hypothetical protein [Portunus trituberculatus]
MISLELVLLHPNPRLAHLHRITVPRHPVPASAAPPIPRRLSHLVSCLTAVLTLPFPALPLPLPTFFTHARLASYSSSPVHLPPEVILHPEGLL